MSDQKLLGISIKNQAKSYILEQIQKYIHKPYAFFHIVSLNPENIMLASEDVEYQFILSKGDIQLIDGIGVALGCAFLKIDVGERISGVDFMEIMLSSLKLEGLRVLLLGGRPNLANDAADCYQQKYPKTTVKGIEGFRNIQKPKKTECKDIIRIITDYKPQVIFAAYGSPEQEKFFSRHRRQLQGIICMGVGGGLDFAAGKISRAPVLMRKLGFEWLYRLIIQPWRWRRQVELIRFVFAVCKQKIFS